MPKGVRQQQPKRRVLANQRWLYALADCPINSDEHQRHLIDELTKFVRKKGRRALGAKVVRDRVVVLTARSGIPKEPLIRKYRSGPFVIVVAYKQKGGKR